VTPVDMWWQNRNITDTSIISPIFFYSLSYLFSLDFITFTHIGSATFHLIQSFLCFHLCWNLAQVRYYHCYYCYYYYHYYYSNHFFFPVSLSLPLLHRFKESSNCKSAVYRVSSDRIFIEFTLPMRETQSLSEILFLLLIIK
jgi:hypothetical protein